MALINDESGKRALKLPVRSPIGGIEKELALMDDVSTPPRVGVEESVRSSRED